MTADWWKVILEAAVLLIAISSATYTGFSNRNRAQKKEVADLAKQAERHRREIDSLKQRIDNAPAKEDVHALQLAMTEIRGEIGVMAETVAPIGHSLRRLEDYLMKRDI